MDAAPGSAAGGAAPAALAADASLAAEAAGAGERSPIGGAAVAGEGPPAEAAAGTSACDARGAIGAPGSAARQRSGPGTAGLARQLAEVLRRLADHEALLRRLLEQGAGAQASEALALQGVDRKVERLLRQVGRPGEPDAAPDAAARPRPGAAAPRRPREGIRELAVWSSCASSVQAEGREDAPSVAESESAERSQSTSRSPRTRSAQVAPTGRRRLDHGDKGCRTVDSFYSTASGLDRARRPGLVGKIVRSPAFDGLCAFVIVCNAGFMGVEAHLTMAHALEHAGLQTDWKPATWLYALQISFTAFYTVELFMRLIVHRHHFFTCANKYWNLFDVVVVLTALYETASGFISFDAYVSIKVAWLRLLRLLKVLKMFRLIRLLRFFRELRTMLASLMGCALALCWSCAVLISLKYLFGLVVIQGLSGYLLDTPLDKMDEATVEGIAAYWGSVPEATLTLYKATTGGSDWSDLASPVREASASSGYIYYLLFLLYIAFFMIALMNVLTGMFVDAAIKCRDKDNEEMIDLVLEDARSEDKIGHFKEFILEQMGERGSSSGRRFSWSVVSDHRLKAPVKDFFKSLHIDYSEARKIFKVLKMEGHADNDVGVDVEEFLQVCEAKLKNGDMVLAALEYETKQLSRSITPILGRMDATMEDVSRRMRHLEESRVSDGGQGWRGTSDWATGGTTTRAGAPPLPSSALVAGGEMGDPTGAPRLETAPHTLQDQPCVLLD